MTTTAPARFSYLLLLLVFGVLSTGGLHTARGATRELRYAQNFQIEHFPTHRLITVKNINRSSQEHFHYALVPKKQALPELPPKTLVVRTPIERTVVMATTFIGYLNTLGLNDKIIGTATPEFINTADVLEKVASGRIRTVQTGQSLDIESILLLRPDLILTSSSGNPLFDVHPQLARTGLPVVLSASYMEAHPLARAEWIKFVAAFFDRDAQAAEIFEGIAQRYNALASKTQNLRDRPTVFCGAPYANVWHVAGGCSYTAQAIHDAGGDYLWADDRSAGGIPLDLERVFLKAGHADVWLNPSSYRSLDALFNADKRFQKFRAAETGMIFNNSKQFSPRGGNNIWERGIVHPDEVLADLIRIFHPDQLEVGDFTFYEHLR